MRKGFISGVIVAGLLFAVFFINNNYLGNNVLQSVVSYFFSVPGYMFAVWLGLPDVLSLPLTLLYFGIMGMLFVYISEKGGVAVAGLIIALICLHWFFNVKLSEELSAIGKALSGLAKGVIGGI